MIAPSVLVRPGRDHGRIRRRRRPIPRDRPRAAILVCGITPRGQWIPTGRTGMALDLNSDLGEGFGPWTMGDDAAMLDIVTSANIACGGHAGDPSIMRKTCAAAVERGVRIGAHVGYRDLAGFGRRAIAVAPAELRDEVLYQIGGLDGFARAEGDRVRYVKPHGALYHAAARDRKVADAVLAAVAEYDPELALLGPAGTELEHAAGHIG